MPLFGHCPTAYDALGALCLQASCPAEFPHNFVAICCREGDSCTQTMIEQVIMIPAHVIEAFTAAFRSVDLFEYFNQMVRGAIGRPLPICAMV